MNVRRVTLATLLIGLLTVGLAPAAWAAGPSHDDKKPNLLFVFSDQQSSDMLGCYGNHQIITPNIDRLAAEGLRFDHCISSSPVCTPYRGMLLSGQHPLYNGAMVNDMQMLPGNGNHFGEVLRDKGYRMGYMAMCTNIDDNFGRLMKKLDEKGIRDNTLVIYTSDHGDLLRSHGIHDWH